MTVIYLASRSPRRRELLAQVGVKFEMLLFREGSRQDAETSEDAYPGEHPDDYVRRVARMKAEAAWQRVVMRKGLRRMPVLAAHTTVALANEMLAKPPPTPPTPPACCGCSPARAIACSPPWRSPSRGAWRCGSTSRTSRSARSRMPGSRPTSPCR